MLKNKKALLIAVLITAIGAITAQTTSPYSRYGYGVLKDKAVGPSKAMGGIGYGLRQKYGANPLNPASYSTVDSLTFMFDIGVDYTKAKLSEGNASMTEDNGGLDYITMLFPVTKGLGVSFGILPYSSVGYRFGGTKTVSDIEYEEYFEGSGGLNDIYIGAGYKLPIEGLSVGANVSYTFGSINHLRSLTSLGTQDHFKLKRNSLKFDIGAQYAMRLPNSDLLTLGAVFSPKMSANAKYEQTTTGLKSEDDTITNIKTDLPMTVGLGFTLIHKEKLTIGADVTFQQWEKARYPEIIMGDDFSNSSERFNNRLKYAVGAEYITDPYSRNILKRTRIRGGLNYSNSYLNVKTYDDAGIQLPKPYGYKEYGATLGFGFPIRDLKFTGTRTTYVNVNFEYKRIAPERKNMVKEEYFGVSLSLNFNELWFMKRKIE